MLRTFLKAVSRGGRRAIADGLPRLGGDEGTNLLEYGLVVILFLTLLFGAMGMGQLLYSYHFISHAAKEATRFAAVHGSTCTSDGSCTAAAGPSNTTPITDFVSSITPQGIAASQVTVTPTWPVQTDSPQVCSSAVTIPSGAGTTTIGPTPNYPGCIVSVEVDYTVNFIFPFFSTSPVKLSSSSEMVIAH